MQVYKLVAVEMKRQGIKSNLIHNLVLLEYYDHDIWINIHMKAKA